MRGVPRIKRHKEMERKYKNRWNKRKELRVKSIRMKIEKRSMERLGHKIRMPEDRRTKHITFACLSNLEKTAKSKKDRCTPQTLQQVNV